MLVYDEEGGRRMDSRLTFALISAYLLGAVPSAYLVARWTAGVDNIRTVRRHHELLPP